MQHIFWAFAVLSFGNVIHYTKSCNEVVCASIVTKCMLMQSCTCSVISCSCCPSCLRCLGNFYTECCDCVNMCENESEAANVTQVFHEERLQGSPALFQALISTPHPDDNWVVFTFPVRVSSILSADQIYMDDYFLQWYSQQEDVIGKDVVNCSAVFLDDCTSQTKCKRICESMGAETSLWFQDGCCECAGCPKHEIYESRCNKCPEIGRKESVDEYDDFGQGDEEQALYDETEYYEEYD